MMRPNPQCSDFNGDTGSRAPVAKTMRYKQKLEKVKNQREFNKDDGETFSKISERLPCVNTKNPYKYKIRGMIIVNCHLLLFSTQFLGLCWTWLRKFVMEEWLAVPST